MVSFNILSSKKIVFPSRNAYEIFFVVTNCFTFIKINLVEWFEIIELFETKCHRLILQGRNHKFELLF